MAFMRVTAEPAAWESFGSAGGFLQSSFWASHKAAFGWEPHGFLVDGIPLGALCRRFPLGRTVVYIPRWSPEREELKNGAYLADVAGAILPLLPEGVIVIRFDLGWEIEERVNRRALAPLRKSMVDIQPPDTVIVDLSPDPDTIFSRMRQKTRYNIRLSAKRGVTVRRAEAREISVWYSIYRETAARDRITIHSEAYYSALLAPTYKALSNPGGSGDVPAVTLLLAEYGGEPIGGIIVAVCGSQAIYLYGASADKHRNLMGSSLLQWEGMLLAKAAGCVSYDMFGIPPDDDPSHPMHGLFQFKTGFGGRIVHTAGCWDAVCRPLEYLLYARIEQARAGYFRKLLKRGIRQR